MSLDCFALPYVRWADVAVMSPHFKTSLRRLYDHELVYVLGGSGTITVENRKYPAQADQLYLIMPHVWHSFIADDDREMPLLGVHFDWKFHPNAPAFPIEYAASEPQPNLPARQSSTVENWDVRQKPFLNLRGRPRVRHLLEELVVERHRNDEETTKNSGALLALALGCIAREARQLQQIEQSSHLGADAIRRVERARHMLESAELNSIETVAQQVGWSGDHLRRMTRAVLQQSPYQLQIAARLRRARHLLRSENLSIAHVALRCGFEDASHFSRVFKKDCGLTPRQFLTMSKKI